MKRQLVIGMIAAAVAAGAYLVADVKPVGAAEAPLVEHVDGMPENFHKGEVACYAIWHTPGEGWHLDVTTAKHRHHFKGRIWVEGGGHFKHVNQWKGTGELAAEAIRGDWFWKSIKREPPMKPKEISFDLVEENAHLSGLNFEVEGKGPLLWELRIGGKDDKDPAFAIDNVKIGHEGHKPPSIPFQTMAHPDEKGHGK